MITGLATAATGAIGGGGALTAAANTAAKTLGKDEFLKLLMAQMRNQNPLDPVKDAEFVAQLSQFSTLEGIQKLNSNFTDLLFLQSLSQGANLIGKTITYETPNTPGSSKGTVESVQVQNGKIQLKVGTQTVEMSQVRGIAVAPAK